MNHLTRQTIIRASECCHAEVHTYEDCDSEDMGFCMECKDNCEHIDVCVECDEVAEDGKCDCMEWQEQCKRMFALYQGEVNAGIHIPAQKDEANAEFRG